MTDLFPSRDAVLEYFSRGGTWRQILILLVGLLVAWAASRLLRRPLESATRPGAISEAPRTAVRSGALVVFPLMLWLWLFLAVLLSRRVQLDFDLLRPAMLLTGALVLVRVGVFILRHSLSPGSRLKAWEGTLTAAIWLLLVLHILGWLPAIGQVLDEYAIELGKVRLSLLTAVSFIFSIAVLMFIALGLSHALQWRVMKSPALDDSLKIAITKLGKFLLLTAAVLVALITAGIDLTALAVFGGALGVGLGLGLQRIVSNFVSGVILGFEGSIRPGDVVTMGKTMGTVEALHARHVVIHTPDGQDILVPNETLLTNEITNWSYGDRNVRLKLPVQVSYQDDPEKAIGILEQVALGHERVLKTPPPAGVLAAFGENGINLELHVWIKDPERSLVSFVSELNRRIWKALKDGGITIPYPHRTVHLSGAAPAPPRSSGS
jgi:small-conductance mechanosensitive channel